MRLIGLTLVLVINACTSVQAPLEITSPAVLPPKPTCPQTVLDNRSDEPINDMDRWNLSIATKRCKELYKNSPCLVKFIKFAPTAYGAICGGLNG